MKRDQEKAMLNRMKDYFFEVTDPDGEIFILTDVKQDRDKQRDSESE